MALPNGKKPDPDLAPSATPGQSGVAPRGQTEREEDMSEREPPSGTISARVAHSILPEPGEVEAVDEGWNEPSDTTAPPYEPLTMRVEALDVVGATTRRVLDPLEFDIPRPGALPAMFFPPASTPPQLDWAVTTPPPSSSAPPSSAPSSSAPPPSAPPTLRITTRPPSVQASRPSTAPGYGYRASQRPDLAGEMKSRFGEGDFSGALLFAEALLASEPAHEEATLYASSCRVGLAEAYLGEIGDRSSIPYVKMDHAEMRAIDLEPTHGFLVAQIDGAATIDEIIDVCGLPEHETLRVLHDLWRREVVGLR